jgi:hypothetical protein
VKETKNSFNLEWRLLKDKALKAEFGSLRKELDDKLEVQIKILQDAKAGKNKKELMKEAAKAAQYSTAGRGNDELLGEANEIQDKTMASLGRTKMAIEESKLVGAATIETLRGQREQIVDIENEIDVIDSNLVRAEKLIGNFARRMATDRIIQAFTAINVVVMLGLVLYVSISGKSLTASSSGSSGGGSGPGAVTFAPSLRPSFQPTLQAFNASISPSYLPSGAPSFGPSDTSSPSIEPTIE